MSQSVSWPENIHSAGYGMVEFGNDRNLFVRFFRKSVRNEARSREAGAPVFEAVDMVSIRQPMERDELITIAAPEYQMRFPQQWQQYQASQTQTQDGMPLEYLLEGKPEIMEQLRSRGVHTVEALAGLSEAGQSRYGMGARALVGKAQEFLEGMKGAAGIKRLQSQVIQRDEEIITLQSQLKEVGDRLARLEAAKVT